MGEVGGCKWMGRAYRDAIGVFLTDAFSLCLALFEGVLVLELGAHGAGALSGLEDGRLIDV